MADFNVFMKKHTNVITFFIHAHYSFFQLPLFQKKLHNYAEHFTIIVFAMSMAYTLNRVALIGMILFRVIELSTVAISLVLTIFCLAVTYAQCYNLKGMPLWARAYGFMLLPIWFSCFLC